MLLDGGYVKRDVNGAYALLEAAAEAGNVLAQFNLAQLIVDREPGEAGMAKAVAYYERAAEAGLADAQYAMSQVYANGAGGKKRDETEARRWLELAAKQGLRYRRARSRHLDGRGPRRPKDHKAGFNWLKRAALGGNVAAQNRVAKLYMQGIGTDPTSPRPPGTSSPAAPGSPIRNGRPPQRPHARRNQAGDRKGQPAAVSARAAQRRTPRPNRCIPCPSGCFVVMEAPKSARAAENPFRKHIMAKINGNEIRPGNVIEHNGGLWVAVKTNPVKPGKGGAYNQVELKNLINGTKLNERFRSAETVEQVRLEQKDFSFLYEQGEALIFMDTESYEQLELQKDFVGDRAAFLQDGMMVTVELYEERPIGISLPDQVTLSITEADPVVKGQTAASSYKPAMLENGIRILVPPFIGSASGSSSTPTSSPTSAAPSRAADFPETANCGCRRPEAIRNSDMARSAILNVMVQAATKAGRSLARDFGEVQNLQVSLKGPGDYVSQADRKAEDIIHTELSRARPGYSFLMEERGAVAGEDEQHRWIVDPLDGTTNFLHGIPIFAISIALERQGQLVAAVVYNPAMDELYTAERGGGAFLNDRRLRVSGRTKLTDAVIGCGMPHLGSRPPRQFPRRAAQRDGRGLGHQAPGCRRARPCLCRRRAARRFLGGGLSPWDVAAGILLIREAGGFVTDRAGGHDMFDGRTIVAGNEAIHRALLKTVRKPICDADGAALRRRHEIAGRLALMTRSLTMLPSDPRMRTAPQEEVAAGGLNG